MNYNCGRNNYNIDNSCAALNLSKASAVFVITNLCIGLGLI